MSRGNKIVLVRIDPATLARIEARMKSRNETTREAEWTLSDYIRHCVAADLAHVARAKKSRKPRASVADTYTAGDAAGKSGLPQTGQTVQEGT